MPSSGVEREQQIYLLGEIYENAAAVIVVLSNTFATALVKVSDGNPFTKEDYEIINNDNWISRYWTYQEMVNPRKVYLVSESNSSSVIHASIFFDKLSQGFEMFCYDHNIKSIEAIQKYPYINSFKAGILEGMVFEQRSIYHAMSNMEYSKSSSIDSKLESLYSFLSKRKNLDVLSIKDDYEKFLELCIRTNDYSFIYNISTNRSSHHQKWKPVSYDFIPIYTWLYAWGSKQDGELHADHLLLKNMILETRSTVSNGTISFLIKILNENVEADSSNVLNLIRANLSGLSFEGCPDPIELERGFYFDQFNIDYNESNIIAICTGVQWTFGAPAMKLAKRVDIDIYDFISSGVFFGNMRAMGLTLTSIKID